MGIEKTKTKKVTTFKTVHYLMYRLNFLNLDGTGWMAITAVFLWILHTMALSLCDQNFALSTVHPVLHI